MLRSKYLVVDILEYLSIIAVSFIYMDRLMTDAFDRWFQKQVADSLILKDGKIMSTVDPIESAECLKWVRAAFEAGYTEGWNEGYDTGYMNANDRMG